MVKVQLDIIGNQIKTAYYHRKEILNDLTIFIQQNRNKDILIASNFSESLYSRNIEQLLIKNRLFEVHALLNSSDNMK